MTYQVLARKLRPQQFDDVVGQTEVVTILQNALEHQRIHHAYLFTGTRGVGKTTLARLLAKSLNCQQGIKANPCGSCDSCQQIAAGCAPDVIEVDAASRTKVEQTRELLDNVPFAPVSARHKVYLIDEVHMLSQHSFNALLKTLEEPPEHIKFILATTEPNKLPITIVSRCLHLNLKAIQTSDIAQALAKALAEEEVTFDETVPTIIAEHAKGSLRDALSLLEQAIALGGQHISLDACQKWLGSVSLDRLEPLLQAIGAQDCEQAIQLTQKLAEDGLDFMKVVDGLLKLLHQVTCQQWLTQSDSNPVIQTLATQFSKEDTQLLYQIALMGKRDLPLAPHAQLGFEMLLLRMIGFKWDDNDSGSTKSTPSAATPQPNITSTYQPRVEPVSTTVTANTNKCDLKSPAPEKVQVTPPPEIETHSNKASSLPTTAEDWATLVPTLALTGISDIVVNHCIPAAGDAKHYTLLLDPNFSNMLTQALSSRIEKALQVVANSMIKLTIKIAESALNNTPSALKEQSIKERKAAAMDDAESSSNVQSLIETFDAKIVDADLLETAESI